MAVRTVHLIKWPDRGHTPRNFTQQFRRFFKQCCVIIDCTEVFIEKPSDLLVQAQVWSNYKHHLTLTFLIGITPQGTISYVYIPLCWWCKEIVECSNLTDYLLIVIADRGLPVMIMPRWLLLRLKLHCLRKARSNWRRLRWIGVENCQLFASMLNE